MENVLHSSSFMQLEQSEQLSVFGGWSWTDWLGAVGGAAGAGATIGSFAGPGGSLVGGIAGAVVGNALYALGDYYDSRKK
ncbi:hypothetical protein RB620_22940 [Paenibacillus sp. LHD-117]|uniref:hypothetical protein n=1 Tax=Paenibacillus sp. LHD-117 TaxID=3071412 RepID=UPI0027DF5F7C|nr:hypothetical protein [Paenibacillus sp. LHD-117]MDQ6422289.1 hypothetical protein [Paenibacillus sp. LHD-117]